MNFINRRRQVGGLIVIRMACLSADVVSTRHKSSQVNLILIAINHSYAQFPNGFTGHVMMNAYRRQQQRPDMLPANNGSFWVERAPS